MWPDRAERDGREVARPRRFYASLGALSTDGLFPTWGGRVRRLDVSRPASTDRNSVAEPVPRDAQPVRPRDYAALSAGWGAALGTVLIAARDKGEEPVHPAEIIPLGVATFALAKLVAKEKVDAWVREPFVEERPDGARVPRGDGLRYAVGELLTCTRCVGTWSALGLVALRVTRPREARVVTAVLGASAVNDIAQAGFTWVCARSNAAQAATARSSGGDSGEHGAQERRLER